MRERCGVPNLYTAESPSRRCFFMYDSDASTWVRLITKKDDEEGRDREVYRTVYKDDQYPIGRIACQEEHEF